MSIGVAVLVVMATVVPVSTASTSASDVSPPDKTALIMGGTAIPTPDDYLVELIKNRYIAPTHPGQDINYVAVTTPEEFWPITGLRVIAPAIASPSIWGPGGAAWPDEPWWKLSGLFDLTIDQSVQAGVTDLEAAMAAHGNDDLVIYGYSQGAVVANLEKRKLAEQFPPGTTAPDIDFVLSGDLNLPNGGLEARFPGLYIPVLDWSFNGPEPTNTPFNTNVITRQYDGLADFPLYPLNLVADVNAVLGMAYVHLNDLDVSLAADPSTSPPIKSQHGDTTYYFFPTQDLPLFGPLRTLGVPEKYIDVVEPGVKVIVELGYDRSIPPGDPTPARLIPPLNPVTVATDLVNALGEGFNNALALTGLAPLLKIPGAGSGADTDDGSVVGSPDTVADRNAVGHGIVHSFSARNLFGTDQADQQVAMDGTNFGLKTSPSRRWRKLTAATGIDGLTFTPREPHSSQGGHRSAAPLAKVGATIGDSPQQAGNRRGDKTIKKAADRATKVVSGVTGHKVDRTGVRRRQSR